jgi:hypothetical protein
MMKAVAVAFIAEKRKTPVIAGVAMTGVLQQE